MPVNPRKKEEKKRVGMGQKTWKEIYLFQSYKPKEGSSLNGAVKKVRVKTN